MRRYTIQGLLIAVVGLGLVAGFTLGGKLHPAMAFALAGVALGAASFRIRWRTSRLPVAQALETVYQEIRMGRGEHRTAMALDFCCIVCMLTSVVMAFRS